MRVEALKPVVSPDRVVRDDRQEFSRISLRSVERLNLSGKNAEYYKVYWEEEDVRLFLKRINDISPGNLKRLELLIDRLRDTARMLKNIFVRGRSVVPAALVYSTPLGILKMGGTYYVAYTFLEGYKADVENDNVDKLLDILNKDYGTIRRKLILDLTTVMYGLYKGRILHNDLDFRNILFVKAKRDTGLGLVVIDVDEGRVLENDSWIVSDILGGDDTWPRSPDHPYYVQENASPKSDLWRYRFIVGFLNINKIRNRKDLIRKIYSRGMLNFIKSRKKAFLDNFFEELSKKTRLNRIIPTWPPIGEFRDLVLSVANEIKNKSIYVDRLDQFIEIYYTSKHAIPRIDRYLARSIVYGYHSPDLRKTPEDVIKRITGSAVSRLNTEDVERYIKQ